ncbi:MAG TPA: diguanylate cyclase [Steroidobacteraceae bacterium]|nr:diguanylate cyclase [Steroidobacteraceae bacterium]
MVGDKNSMRPASSGQHLPWRFPEPIESEFIEFSLGVFKPGIRAWHTAILCVAVVVLIGQSALTMAGYPPSALPFSLPQMGPLQLILAALAVSSRVALCVLSWREDFLRVYARAALPLALVGHLCINAIFAGQIYGPHPGNIATVAVWAFGASFLTGLQLRQSLLVNCAVLGLLAANAWGRSLPAVAVASVIGNIALAVFMAGVVALALERSVRALYRENQRVTEMAASDGLTGLRNRRAFDEHLRRVWQLALRDKRALGVLLIDVDFFKAFNDSLGHQAGDAALQAIAKVVAATARRPLDLSARYGGEELAIILYDVTREYVADVAQHVQRKVEELEIRHPRSAVAPVVTVSTGGAFVRPNNERSPQGAIMLADRGLYAAKRAGRNRVTLLDRDLEAITTGVFSSNLAPANRGSG